MNFALVPRTGFDDIQQPMVTRHAEASHSVNPVFSEDSQAPGTVDMHAAGVSASPDVVIAPPIMPTLDNPAWSGCLPGDDA